MRIFIGLTVILFQASVSMANILECSSSLDKAGVRSYLIAIDHTNPQNSKSAVVLTRLQGGGSWEAIAQEAEVTYNNNAQFGVTAVPFLDWNSPALKNECGHQVDGHFFYFTQGHVTTAQHSIVGKIAANPNIKPGTCTLPHLQMSILPVEELVCRPYKI